MWILLDDVMQRRKNGLDSLVLPLHHQQQIGEISENVITAAKSPRHDDAMCLTRRRSLDLSLYRRRRSKVTSQPFRAAAGAVLAVRNSDVNIPCWQLITANQPEKNGYSSVSLGLSTLQFLSGCIAPNEPLWPQRHGDGESWVSQISAWLVQL